MSENPLDSKTSVRKAKQRDYLLGFLGITFVITFWFLATLDQLDYVFPSPQATLVAFGRLVASGTLYAALETSLYRAIIGVFLAIFGGFSLGLVLGYFPIIDKLTRWILSLMLAIPPIIIVVMNQVWFGTSTVAVIVTVTLVISPLMIVATRDAVQEIDPNLQEMATVFGMSPNQILLHVTVPAIAPPVISTSVIALGQSVRLTVMAELLITTTGLGAAVRQAQVNIETPDVFALAIVIASIAFGLELLFIRPMKNRRKSMGMDVR